MIDLFLGASKPSKSTPRIEEGGDKETLTYKLPNWTNVMGEYIGWPCILLHQNNIHLFIVLQIFVFHTHRFHWMNEMRRISEQRKSRHFAFETC